MVDIVALKDEVTNDPLARGYIGMSDQQVADDLNTAYRTYSRDTVSGSEIFNMTDDAEYAALSTDAQRSSWDRVCAIDSIDTSNGIAKAREAELFGAGTQTRANLIALKNPSITRAQELNILENSTEIGAAHVAAARAL